jgi:hypothetical protein
MEIFAGVMGLFVVGLLGYAGAQLRSGVRDLVHALALRRHAWSHAGARAAGDGPMLMRGRARALRLLSPPAGGTAVVAWAARSAYGFHADAESVPFLLEASSGADAGVSVEVDARRLVLLTTEATDLFGNRVRLLEPDSEVQVYGWLEQRDGRVCLRDLPGRGVVVAAPRHAVVANLTRGMLALCAAAIYGIVVVTAHLP